MNDPTSAATVEGLAPKIGYRFRHAELLLRALTHSSFAYETGKTRGPGNAHYESIEFLGDAVLGLLVAEMIFRSFPDYSEGEMSRLRASLVSARSLTEKAEKLDLGRHLRLGRGERASGGPSKHSILADAFEALLGAIYLDGGIRAARAFVRRQFGNAMVQSRPTIAQAGDYKTRLQEIVQAVGGPPPGYAVVSEEGPPHRKRFEVEVRLPGGGAFRAAGWSKKQAEQEAAKSALRSIGVEVDPPPAGG